MVRHKGLSLRWKGFTWSRRGRVSSSLSLASNSPNRVTGGLSHSMLSCGMMGASASSVFIQKLKRLEQHACGVCRAAEAQLIGTVIIMARCATGRQRVAGCQLVALMYRYRCTSNGIPLYELQDVSWSLSRVAGCQLVADILSCRTSP